MSCSNPIDAAVLADYWLVELGHAEEEAVEEHLLDCDRCGALLREVITLAEGVRSPARKGCLRMVVSNTFLKRAAEEGLRVREYAVPPGGGVQCTVSAEDDILIGRLAAKLSGVKRVDLSICDERGVEQLRLSDIPVHTGASSIIYQESITFAKAAPTHKAIARLITFDEAGAERLLGEYTFNHTRSCPAQVLASQPDMIAPGPATLVLYRTRVFGRIHRSSRGVLRAFDKVVRRKPAVVAADADLWRLNAGRQRC